MTFPDRKEAGRRLAAALARYRNGAVVVIALPRGGVPVAAEIALAIHAPLGLLVVRKLGLPRQPELAMGAVVAADPPMVVRSDAVLSTARISPGEFDAVLQREIAEAKRRVERYTAGRKQPPLAGRLVILVDDGMATGASMRVAVHAVRAAGPRGIVVAVPVAAATAVDALRAEVDDLVCLETHWDLEAIGWYYTDFTQVSDEDVVRTLDRVDRTARRAP